MSNTWINQFIGRNQKSLKRRRASRQLKRRLLVQSLETRQLLAGDVLDTDHVPSEISVAATESGVHSAHMAHPAAMALVSLSQATNTVVSSGDWSDPSVWENGQFPDGRCSHRRA